MRQDDLGTYQMLWDCTNCDTKGLLGLTHRHCPSCGSPQDPAARYFPTDDQKVSVENHVYHGADWRCEACDTPNGALAEFCMSCGSPKDKSKEVKRRAEHRVGDRQTFETDSSSTARKELNARPTAPPSALPPVKKSQTKAVVLGIVALVVVVILVALFWKKDAAVVVTGHSWSRSIDIQTFTAVSESGWRDQVPSGAYSVSCYRAVRDTKQVPDGEECFKKRVDKGDGTFKEVRECTPKYREEPIYDQKCNYTIDKWKVTDTANATGSGFSPEPTWPDPKLTRKGSCLGCQREGSRDETYTVHLKDNKDGDETYECTFPQAVWSSYAVGKVFKTRVGVVTGRLSCDELKQQ